MTTPYKFTDLIFSMYPPLPTGGMTLGMSRGVTITHKPTGLSVSVDSERSQHRNRDVALAALAEKLAAHVPDDWTTPTTYLRRFGDAMALLCAGHRPADEVLTAWLDTDADDMRLQEFAVEHGPAWAQGIGIIDAARMMADQPTEGVEHEEAPAPYADSTPSLHVGDSSFESWFEAKDMAGLGTKQLACDAYAAGMGDPLVMARAERTTSRITVDLKQASDLLSLFAGEPTEITLMTGAGHSGEGLYAIFNADPDGAVYLGETDEEATPEAPAAAEAPSEVPGWYVDRTVLTKDELAAAVAQGERQWDGAQRALTTGGLSHSLCVGRAIEVAALRKSDLATPAPAVAAEPIYAVVLDGERIAIASLRENADHAARTSPGAVVVPCQLVPLAAAPAAAVKPSPTAGMSIAQRILHVGGRNNAAGYVEFGSTQAVEALIRHVLRDAKASTEPASRDLSATLRALGDEAEKKRTAETNEYLERIHLGMRDGYHHAARIVAAASPAVEVAREHVRRAAEVNARMNARMTPKERRSSAKIMDGLATPPSVAVTEGASDALAIAKLEAGTEVRRRLWDVVREVRPDLIESQSLTTLEALLRQALPAFVAPPPFSFTSFNESQEGGA